MSWASDGPAQAVSGDRFTATGLERDTCYRWIITATDRLGHARSRTTGPVAIDPTKPVVQRVRVSVARRHVGATGAIPMFVSWVLGKAPVGTTTFQLAKTGDGGASWQAIAHAPASAKSETTYIGGGRPTTLSVRARSGTGSNSAWAISSKVTARLAEEDASGVTHSSGWSRVSLSSASGDHRLESTKRRASVTYRFTGSSIALVAARGKSLGHAIVRIDGKQVATVTLKASNAVSRQIVWTRGLPSGKHTITVVVKDGRVVVDGFVTTTDREGRRSVRSGRGGREPAAQRRPRGGQWVQDQCGSIGVCACRKPSIAMFQRALSRHPGATAAASVVVGDSLSGLQAAAGLGARSVLVGDAPRRTRVRADAERAGVPVDADPDRSRRWWVRGS